MIILDILVFIGIFMFLLNMNRYWRIRKFKSSDNYDVRWFNAIVDSELIETIQLLLNVTNVAKKDIVESNQFYWNNKEENFTDKQKEKIDKFDPNVYDFHTGNMKIKNNYFFFSVQNKSDNKYAIIIKDLKSNTGFLINDDKLELVKNIMDGITKNKWREECKSVEEYISKNLDGECIGDVNVANKLNKLSKKYFKDIIIENVISSPYLYSEINEFNRAYIIEKSIEN